MVSVFFDPGALSHRMMLQERQEVPDGCGGTIVSWVDVASLWAALRPIGARSFERADQIDEALTHAITIRHRDDVASGWRLTKDARVFDVVTVHDPDESRRYLKLETTEKGR